MIKSRTYIAVALRETIKEQLSDRRMSLGEFATQMNTPEQDILDLLNGKIQLTANIAIRLGNVLGASASFRNNLEAIYREKILKVFEESEADAGLKQPVRIILFLVSISSYLFIAQTISFICICADLAAVSCCQISIF